MLRPRILPIASAPAAAPITDGEAGLRVVRLLEAANESMAERGHLVSLKSTVKT